MEEVANVRSRSMGRCEALTETTKRRRSTTDDSWSRFCKCLLCSVDKGQQQFAGTSDGAMFASPAAAADTADEEHDEGGSAGSKNGREGETKENGREAHHRAGHRESRGAIFTWASVASYSRDLASRPNDAITRSNVFQVCSTMVAEHLVSDLLEQSNLQELNGSEKQFEVETERLNSRLEHARANNAVLALTLHESKAQCDR